MNRRIILRALVAARRDGNEEAADELRSMLGESYRAETPSPTEGMSTGQRYAANLGAGTARLGRGIADFFGQVSDEDVAAARKRDTELASSVPYGGAVQAAGEVAPTMLIPFGAVSKGLTAIPKVGNALRGLGVGSRVLPTMLAEGATTGAVLGATQATGEGESRLANIALGAAGGAALPGAMMGAGKIATKVMPNALGGQKMAQRAVGRNLAGELGNDAGTVARSLSQHNRAVSRGIDIPPASTAMVTQNANLAAREVSDRASPRAFQVWAAFDEHLDNARWDILDRRLSTSQTLASARKATQDFADAEVPRLFQRVKWPEFRTASADFSKGLRSLINEPTRIADPHARRVLTHILSTEAKLKNAGSGWTPAAMWKERQTLASWLAGTPPSGKVEVRAPKLDVHIKQAMDAIDATLDRATGGAWTPFLIDFGDRLGKEAQAKAGINIRNAFFDDALGVVRGASTAAGNPKLTRAQTQRVYSNFGSTKFGPSLSTDSDEAMRTVVDSLNAGDVIQRAKSTMTGRGGSQTAPLLARAAGSVGGSHGLLADVAASVAQYVNQRERDIMTRALSDPAFAESLISGGVKQLSPLAQRDLMLIASATRAGLPIAAGAFAE